MSSLDAWLAERHGPQGLVHGDFRLDNLLFGAPAAPRALTVVDWQTVGWGGAMTDVSYFLGGGLPVGGPTAAERELLGEYHAGAAGARRRGRSRGSSAGRSTAARRSPAC